MCMITARIKKNFFSLIYIRMCGKSVHFDNNKNKQKTKNK